MVAAMASGRTKFQAALARATVSLPVAVKTAAPTMLAQLTSILSDKLDLLEQAKERLNSLQILSS